MKVEILQLAAACHTGTSLIGYHVFTHVLRSKSIHVWMDECLQAGIGHFCLGLGIISVVQNVGLTWTIPAPDIIDYCQGHSPARTCLSFCLTFFVTVEYCRMVKCRSKMRKKSSVHCLTEFLSTFWFCQFTITGSNDWNIPDTCTYLWFSFGGVCEWVIWYHLNNGG